MVTAFEKWYTELPIREDAEDFTLETHAKYMKGWKAALGFAIGICIHCGSSGEIEERLKDELEELSNG